MPTIKSTMRKLYNFSHTISLIFPHHPKKELFITTNDFAVLHLTPPLSSFSTLHRKIYTAPAKKKFFMFFHAESTKVLFTVYFSSAFPPLCSFITFNFTSILSLPLCILQKCTGEEKQKKLFNAGSIDATFYISFSNVASSFSMSEMKT